MILKLTTKNLEYKVQDRIFDEKFCQLKRFIQKVYEGIQIPEHVKLFSSSFSGKVDAPE